MSQLPFVEAILQDCQFLREDEIFIQVKEVSPTSTKTGKFSLGNTAVSRNHDQLGTQVVPQSTVILEELQEDGHQTVIGLNVDHLQLSSSLFMGQESQTQLQGVFSGFLADVPPGHSMYCNNFRIIHMY